MTLSYHEPCVKAWTFRVMSFYYCYFILAEVLSSFILDDHGLKYSDF